MKSTFKILIFVSLMILLGFGTSALAATLCPKSITCNSKDCPGYVGIWEFTWWTGSAGTYYLTGAFIQPTYAECNYRLPTTTFWLAYSTMLPLKADTTPMPGRLWKTDQAGLTGTCMRDYSAKAEIAPEQCPFINKK